MRGFLMLSNQYTPTSLLDFSSIILGLHWFACRHLIFLSSTSLFCSDTDSWYGKWKPFLSQVQSFGTNKNIWCCLKVRQSLSVSQSDGVTQKTEIVTNWYFIVMSEHPFAMKLMVQRNSRLTNRSFSSTSLQTVCWTKHACYHCFRHSTCLSSNVLNC